MRGLWAGLVFSVAAQAALAQEVTLTVPEADETVLTSLRAASLTLAVQRDGADNAQDYIAAARADYRRLLTGLYAEGYYGGTISIRVDGVEAAQLDPLVRHSAIRRIELNVTPGPRFTFGQADVSPRASGTELPEAFATGATARSGVITDAARAAVDGWRAQGHALAHPTAQSITADHPDRQLDVGVTIAPGPRLTFGAVTITGAQAVRPDRIRAIAGIPEGATFHPGTLTRAEANLRRTGAFTSATVIEADRAAGSTLPLTLTVAEQVPRRLGFGAEYSSVSGLTLSGYWLHRNFLGGAERFRVDAEISGLTGGTGGPDYSLGAHFLRPATFRSDTDLYVTASLSQVDEPFFKERQASVETGIIRRIRDDVVIEYGLGLRSGDITDSLGRRRYSLAYANLQGRRDGRDDPLNAKSGYYVNLALTPFIGLSDTDDGVRLLGDARLYRSLGDDQRLTFAARGLLGAMTGANPLRVPASYLFYSGGGGSVRGQPYQSLAVDLGGGNERGGTAFFAAQLEARYAVTDNIGLVGFYDAGFVGDTPFSFDNGDWHSGAGLGVRYNTGIGPIRLDLATPASGANAGKALEIYLGIGQAF